MAKAADSHARRLANPVFQSERISVQYIIVTIAATVVLAVVALVYVARSRNSERRSDFRTQSINFRAVVRVKVRTALFGTVPIRGPMDLIVRDKGVEISNPFPPARVLFGQEYYFEADDLQVEAVSGLLGREWIAIRGESGGRSVDMLVGRNSNLAAIWEALVHVGAVPIGIVPRT